MNPQDTPKQSSRSTSSSTRPSPFAHLLHDRGVRFAAGLAVVVAIPVAVLFYFQFRSLGDIEETSAVVLRQLSRDNAESLAREIEENLKRPHIDLLLRPAQQSRLDPPDFAWLDTVFAEGMARQRLHRGALVLVRERRRVPGQVLRVRPGEPADPRA